MSNQHYLNGQWVADEDLKISVFDLAVLRGFGTFDYLRTYNFKPFRLEDHLDRFEQSNRRLGITISKNRDELRAIILDGIKRNNEPNIGIRMLATGGIGVDSITQGEPSLIMVYQTVTKPEQHYYSAGAKVITYPTPRHVPEAKSLNYLTAILAMQQAAELDCLEALYVDPPLGDYSKRRIYEGTRTNFFAVKDGELWTPREDMLAGITRKVVLELAAQTGVAVHQDNLYLEEVADKFEEAFITSSDKEIVPVIQIDDLVVGEGRPGTVTLKLMEALERSISDAS